ncbi:MAG: OFA family MFS transporter [Rikenellaceae bacterium]
MKSGNRWINAAIPALMIHGCIGTVYCWSLLTDAIHESVGDGYEWAFSLAIFFLGLSAAFLGPLVERDVRRSSLYSMLFFSAGMILSGVACWIGSLPLFFISYGVIMGVGLGLGYLSPVKTLILWFKDNKGLATGLAISGFGLAKVIATPSLEWVMDNYGIVTMFISHGIFYAVIMFVGSRLLKKPLGTEADKSKPLTLSHWASMLGKVLKLPGLWAYWMMFFLNITAGLAIISHEKVLFNMAGYGEYLATSLMLCALFNTLGRFVVSWGSDLLKNRLKIFVAVLAISSGVCLLSYTSSVMWLVALAVLLCNCGYGAIFSTMPCALSDRYGVGSVSEVHGVILSAWAFAGLCGNQLANFVLSQSDSNAASILVAAGVIYAVGLTISIYYYVTTRKTQKSWGC